MGKKVPVRTRLSSTTYVELLQYCEVKRAVAWRIIDRAVSLYLRKRRPAGIKMESEVTPSDVVELKGNRSFASNVQSRLSSYNLPPVETPILDRPIISSRRVSKPKPRQCHVNEVISQILT